MNLGRCNVYKAMSSSLHPQHHLHLRCVEKEEDKEEEEEVEEGQEERANE